MPKPQKGRFVPKHPEKFNGDPTSIVYRSGMELRLMKYLDENTNVLEWQSDVVGPTSRDFPNGLCIPYRSPLDNRIHRYFPDMVCKVRKPDGTIQIMVIEVKPESQTAQPNKPKRKNKRYINEMLTWGVNTAKWESAKQFCDHKGWEFRIITEKDLGITYK
jgi:hypothetical protein